MTAATARQQIAAFLREAKSRGIRCVKIVHGKGLRSPDRQPLLKSLCNGYLRRHGEVMAFASARPNDGGTGAVYVLLRG